MPDCMHARAGQVNSGLRIGHRATTSAAVAGAVEQQAQQLAGALLHGGSYAVSLLSAL